MSFSRVLLLSAVVIFGAIGVTSIVKKRRLAPPTESVNVSQIEHENFPTQEIHTTISDDDFPQADRIAGLFYVGPNKLPIVETVTYRSSVPWLQGRPAWIADYAAHYNTSRHFIARSLNRKPDYFTQKVGHGDQFNVFRADKKINFYLLADITRCKMAFYYVDTDTDERVHLKTYDIGVGRKSKSSPTGSLTPLGRFTLGSKVAIYKPGVQGFFQDEKVEMIRIFGTRWIPFEEIKGFGIHGAPWNDEGEIKESIGQMDSDGCIRLKQNDMEELFSIVITKPTFVEIVEDFKTAKLPGQDVTARKADSGI